MAYTVKYDLKKRKNVIPELDRLWFETLHCIAGIPATEVVKRMSKSKKFRCSVSTIRNLRNGKTTYPTLRTAFIIGKAAGKQIAFVDGDMSDIVPSNNFTLIKKR